MCQGIYWDAVPKFDLSEFPSYKFEENFFLHDKRSSKSQSSWQSEVSYAMLPVSIGTELQEADAKFFLIMVHLEQVDLQKRVLVYPMSFV